MILNALEGRALPIYGDGGNVRDWLFVEDHCSGIVAALTRGASGEKYNLGGGSERTNVDMVDAICRARARAAGRAQSVAQTAGCELRGAEDLCRGSPWHDGARRRAQGARRAGWRRARFESGLAATVVIRRAPRVVRGGAGELRPRERWHGRPRQAPGRA
jgi:dTDP-glucose 4,6-dehydratase